MTEPEARTRPKGLRTLAQYEQWIRRRYLLPNREPGNRRREEGTGTAGSIAAPAAVYRCPLRPPRKGVGGEASITLQPPGTEKRQGRSGAVPALRPDAHEGSGTR